jgi:hypothetical protein
MAMNAQFPKMSLELQPLVETLNQNVIQAIEQKLPDLADSKELDNIYRLLKD